ncbi:Golgi integral membrane protein 4b isoform X1 [Misgurnus anguillicaudatus]|uniref:Golgi integral membrane protein 4b isoform X1 n=1 Tax=Misgurnus anguillicaudatus TaxID=75329 RepID=UPI0024359A64|nr:Golgi integral membrane protein 4b isoform X1 [Misgurnus anguillicaudatus]
MGKSICSRRQRRLFQICLFLLFICGTVCAFMISYEMHKELKQTEATALQYQQHQESLSAQLQVVYEHHSKLEKSLQKERLEHKKTEEEFLLFKRETQKTLNKEKQDSTSRLNVLQTQHQILQSQHEDLKMQYYELQKKNQNQGENHERIIDEHRQELDHLHREKEVEISQLKENVYNLQVENKQLRKAHQDIYTQMLDVREQHKNLKASKDHLTLTLEDHKNALVAAQLQVDELRRLKENRNKASSAGQADQIRKFATERTHNHILETVAHRHRPNEEQDKKPNQVEGYMEKRKGFFPQEEMGKKGGKGTSKDREGEDESKKPLLEHFLSNPKELAMNSNYTLSQTLKKQIRMEPLHGTEGHLGALDPVIAVGNAVKSHGVIAGQENAKEDTQHYGTVAGKPEQEDHPDEEYDDAEDETLDDSVHRVKRADEEDNEEDPYNEHNGAEDRNSLNLNRSGN